MKRKYLKLALAVLSTTLFLLPSGTAIADEANDNDPSKGVVPTDVTGQSSVQLVGGVGTPSRSRATLWVGKGTLQGSATRTISPSGSAANISTGFTSNVVSANLDTISRITGNSSAMWFGSKPYNASSVSLTDQMWANSLGATGVSVGAGWGISIGVNTATTTFSNEVPNSWKNTHDYAGITFSGLLLNVNQNSTALFRFGSASYAIQAN